MDKFNSTRVALSRAATCPKSPNAFVANPERVCEKTDREERRGDAREPFLYRTALWLRHRCVYDHPPTRHALSPPHASRTWRSPRRPLAVDGRDAVVFSARARVRVFHRSRSMARLPRDASRATRPSLGSIDTVDHIWTRSRRARRAARLASSSRDSRPERFRRKTRASWGHRGFFRVLPAFASLTRPRLPRSFSLYRPTDNHGQISHARRTSR